MPCLRSGIDMVDISRLEGLHGNIRQRFLERVYSPAELEITGESDMRLAGRFAAKEAVAKALGCGIGPVSWQEIEILNTPAGEPRLHLHGNAQTLALEMGIEEWSVSISHTAQFAVAIAVAV